MKTPIGFLKKNDEIIKAMAKSTLESYGHDAYEAFCLVNPGARDEEHENHLLAQAGCAVIPQLCGPFGRVMP